MEVVSGGVQGYGVLRTFEENDIPFNAYSGKVNSYALNHSRRILDGLIAISL